MPPEVASHVHHPTVVHSPFHHRIHLDGQARPGCHLDPVQHGRHREAHVVHRHEGGIVQGVEGDRDPVQSGRDQRLGLAGQQRSVGGEGHLASGGGGEHGDQLLDALAQEGLAAGKPDLLHPQLLEGAGQGDYLLEGQQQVSLQELVFPVEYLGRHAVPAPEVASVGHREPQVTNGTPPGIHHHWSHLDSLMVLRSSETGPAFRSDMVQNEKKGLGLLQQFSIVLR